MGPVGLKLSGPQDLPLESEEELMTTIDKPRQAAIRRLQAKREFRLHLAVFVVVNTMLIII